MKMFAICLHYLRKTDFKKIKDGERLERLMRAGIKQMLVYLEASASPQSGWVPVSVSVLRMGNGWRG